MTTSHDPLVHVVDDDSALRDSLAFMLETNDIGTRLYAGAAVAFVESRKLRPGSRRMPRSS